MLEILGGSVLGSAIGGIFRLAPEVLKWLDRRNERAHELAMFDRQVDLEKTRGEIKLQEVAAQRDAAIDTGAMEAFRAAIEQQAKLAQSAGGWAASASAAVRPIVTYWVWALYSAAFATLLWVTWQASQDPRQLVALVLTPDFMALLAGITNYWFLDRTLSKRGL